VAVIVRRGVGDVSMEETEGRCEGFADSFRVGAEAGNIMTLGIVDGDQSADAIYDVVLAFGLGSKDSGEAGVVIDEGECFPVAPKGWFGQALEVEEDALPDVGGWKGGTGNMEVMVLEIGLSAGKTLSIKACHEIYIGAGEVGVIR
jgi:hypothetical protein